MANKKILENINFGLVILLSFLFIFSEHIHLPTYLMSLGRMHPLLLHLPIGMFVMLCLILGLKKEGDDSTYIKYTEVLLPITVFITLLTALFGLFLGAEKDSYVTNEIALHKNTGFAFAIFLYLFSLAFERLTTLYKYIALGSGLILLLVAGHNGGNITHGKDFLFPQKEVIADVSKSDNPIVYTALIKPIIEKKCVACHGKEKSKNGLLMSDTSSFIKGGKNGSSFIAGNADSSLMIKYINLPNDHKLHMPPSGKTQLTKDEIVLLTKWINSGASFTKKYKDYKAQDLFAIYLSNFFNQNKKPAKIYPFEALAKKEIDAMNTSYRSVNPLCQSCPAVEATYLLANEYSTEKVKELSKIKTQLVELNMTNIPVSDADLDIINGFSSLEKLILNGSKITDAGVLKLNNLQNLESISIINTKVTSKIDAIFSKLQKLQNVYCDVNSVSEKEQEIWQKKFPKIHFIYAKPDENKLKLVSPVLINENLIIGQDEQVALSHPIKGVVIRYTTDGSEVDSVNGQIYTKPFSFETSMKIRAIAVKDGWLKSNTAMFDLMKKGSPPTYSKFITQPNPKYNHNGIAAFTDSEKGDPTNLLDANWLGYNDNSMQTIFGYDKAKIIKKITVDYSKNVPSYIFSPTSIKVFGSNDEKNFTVIGSLKLKPDEENISALKVSNIAEVPLNGKAFKYYKVECNNVKVIPKWHPGKGTLGWLFIDEVFFYE